MMKAKRSILICVVLFAFVLSACLLSGPQRIYITATPEPTLTPEPSESAVTPLPPDWTPTPWPYPFSDENVTLSGICFEAALDAAGTTFVLHNAAELIEFYDLADNSHFCRHPVTRYPFDFSNSRVLAGLWSAGRGCTAQHDVLDTQRDDADRTLTIRLRFVTEGDCPYELVRPFWIGIDGAQDYDVKLVVE